MIVSLSQTQDFLTWVDGFDPLVGAAMTKAFPDWGRDRSQADAAAIVLAVDIYEFIPNPLDYPEDRQHNFVMPDKQKQRQNLRTFGFTEKALTNFKKFIFDQARTMPARELKDTIEKRLLAAGWDPRAFKFHALKEQPSQEMKDDPSFKTW